MTRNRAATTALALFLSVGAFAANAAGTWTGKIQMPLPPIPANAPPAQKAMVAKLMAQVKTGKLLLNLKGDKTYTAQSVGLPSRQPSDGGTWSQAGSLVTITPKRAGAKPQSMTMSADGKTMVLLIPGGRGKVVFTR